jgi:DNA-binding GntR family transcriptional regulator
MGKKTKNFGKLKIETLVDQSVKLMREAIVSGEFPPGSKVSLRELSEKWGISRTPLREASRVIESEGLAVSIPRKGFIVKMFSIEEVQEIYSIRLVLESLAIKLACEYCNSKDLNKIKKIKEEIEKIKDSNKVDIKKLQRINREFHFSIYKLSKNKMLLDIISNLWDRSSTMIYIILSSPNRIDNLIKEHNLIYESLVNKDKKAIEKALCNHLHITQNLVLKYVQSYGKGKL